MNNRSTKGQSPFSMKQTIVHGVCIPRRVTETQTHALIST